jgi:hypothetical protein
MAWISTGNGSSGATGPDWILSTDRMQINQSPSRWAGVASSRIYTLSYTGTSYNWKSNKSYQFSTKMRAFHSGATGSSFSMTPAWSDTLTFTTPTAPSQSISLGTTTTTYNFYHYSSPPSSLNSTYYMNYKANGTFSSTNRNTGILGLTATEIDFRIQGFSFVKKEGQELNNNPGVTNSNSLGWYYDRPLDCYYWYDSSINDQYPVGGPDNSKISDFGYRTNNYIGKLVPYGTFNLSFTYQMNDTPFPFSVYLSPSLPITSAWSTTQPYGSVLLGTVSAIPGQTASYSAFYGLRGGQYVYFVGPNVGTSSSTYSSIYLLDIKIEGGYQSGNNRQYLLTNSASYSNPTTLTPIGLTGATYTAFVGSGNTVNATQSISLSQIFSKLGNGAFKSGVWENGVWNSGWRVDDEMYEFYDVYLQFSYNRLKKWRVQIQGPTSSVAEFTIGDNISVGNIVAIDINDDRRLLKNYFTIINKTVDTIIVEFDNNFPLRRIKRDSENHRIYVTKNVWLSGGFLNGYFKGIWNYGLFKGYPLITEMYDSHWVDGIFDGGHFNTVKYTVPNFYDTLFSTDSNYFGYVGLTFSTPHRLTKGDLVTINKTDKTINPQYDGEWPVLSIVNNYHIIVDIFWGSNTFLEGGSLTVNKSKGVIQNMSFKSNNRSRATSQISNDSDAVFNYNSWIDVNYDSNQAVNIGKPQTLINSLSQRTYSENNLYGYPTLDVLSSDSVFRDSYSLTIRKYKLGTKYKIFNDFIGESSKFQDQFGATGGGDVKFISLGWTYSRQNTSSLTFSRTVDVGGNPDIFGEELRVQAIGSGGVLDITPTEGILNRSTDVLERFRYTKVSFDALTFSSNYTFNEDNEKSPAYPKQNTLDNIPSINFNNINKVRRLTYIGTFSVYSSYVDATFLPIYKNINHLLTTKKTKVEYFYNKRNLSMVFRGDATQTSTYIIDNLNFYEVDMIPFFQYFTEDTINKGVEIPFQGISPFIDYKNANFNFIDNIAIGLDSIQTQNSNTAVSGVGIGIGGGVSVGIGVIYEQAAPNNPNLFLFQGPSDIRLKTNINKIGVSNNGINIYEFRFINQPNDLYQGVIAQELIGTEFESATRIESDGYYHVDYSKLDVEFKKIN